jgi:hypothetical protein
LAELKKENLGLKITNRRTDYVIEQSRRNTKDPSSWRWTLATGLAN